MFKYAKWRFGVKPENRRRHAEVNDRAACDESCGSAWVADRRRLRGRSDCLLDQHGQNCVLLPELSDHSISSPQGRTLADLGHEFEVPGTVLDGTQTKLHRDQVILTFRSGSRLGVSFDGRHVSVPILDEPLRLQAQRVAHLRCMSIRL